MYEKSTRYNKKHQIVQQMEHIQLMKLED